MLKKRCCCGYYLFVVLLFKCKISWLNGIKKVFKKLVLLVVFLLNKELVEVGFLYKLKINDLIKC